MRAGETTTERAIVIDCWVRVGTSTGLLDEWCFGQRLLIRWGRLLLSVAEGKRMASGPV